MGKLVRVLVIISTPLAVGALVFGIFLYNKRELLVGRTALLEETIIAVSNFIEEEDPEQIDDMPHVGRDISSVGARVLTTPDIDSFWEDYKDTYETTGMPRFEWNNTPTRAALREFYALDGEGKPKRDINNRKDRNGRMKALLDGLRARVAKQYEALNLTRSELAKTRKELEDTIVLHNDEKIERRKNLVTISDQRTTISGLEDDKRSLKGQVSNLEQEKLELNEEIKGLNKEIAEHIEEKQGLEQKISDQKTRIKELQIQIDNLAPGTPGGSTIPGGAGDKGNIVSVNEGLNFTIVKLNEAFIAQIKTAQANGGSARFAIDLYVRPNVEGAKVTNKIRLERFDFENGVGIGSILLDWKQAPLRSGDIVYN